MRSVSFTKAILFAILFFASYNAVARKFYISTSGNDGNNGTSQTTPWKTLAFVQTKMSSFIAGDTISFKCGDSFSGTLTISKSGTSGNPIVFNSYGVGAKPIFTGTASAIDYLIQSNNNYVVVDGFQIIDPVLTDTGRREMAHIRRAITFRGTNCVAKNNEISRVGIGIYISQGSNCSIENNTIHHLKMIVNDVILPDNDYGGAPIWLAGNNNTVTNNTCYSCWAISYDYGVDGGGFEFFDEGIGAKNNYLAYNTMYENDGIIETSYTGSCDSNTIAYNKFTNNNSIAYFQDNCTGWKFYNNVIVETSLLLYPTPKTILSGRSGYTSDVVFKNNILNITTGSSVLNAARFTSFTHTNNIYKLSGSSTLGFTLGTAEISTSAAIWSSTTGSPQIWNYNLTSTSPAINAGSNVNITYDFAGNIVNTPPDAGIYEYLTSTPSASLNATSASGTISCFGGNTTVTISATGGTAPYIGTGSFTVSAGNYSYIVTDASGTRDTVNVSITQPTAITVSVSSGTITTTGGTTTVVINATGGTGSTYTYSLDGGIYQTSNTFNNVSSGNHNVNVKDANGCIVLKSFFINAPVVSPLLVTATSGAISCNGGTAIVTVSATGGTAPYTGTGAFSANAGLHSYTVSDVNGNSQTTSITLTQPTVITVSMAAGTIAVYGGSTTVTVTSTGGTGTRTYKLDNGSFQTSNIFNNVLAGVHSVIVKDANGCTQTSSITVNQPAAIALSINAVATPILCSGNASTITITGSGGTPPYTGTGSFTVFAGVHNYTLTDANGTTTSTSITVTEPLSINVNASAGTITTLGGTTTITSTPTGGVSPYTYKLDNGVFQTSNIFNNVVAGSHTVTVNDLNGCIKTTSLSITQPSASLVANVTSGVISCNGGSTNVVVTASGGTAPYTGTGTFSANAGLHTYVVTDVNGIAQSNSITIAQPTAIVVSSTSGTITTLGGTTSITVNSSGGTSPYTYTLDNGTYQSSNIFNNVIAGTHTIVVKDANGCTKTTSLSITQPSANLIANVTSGVISCYGGSTNVVVTASGGTAPYTGTGTFSANAGLHTYVVTDANGIAQSNSITIAQPTAIVVSSTSGTITTLGGTTSITVNSSGGTSPYTYTLDNGTYQSSNIFNNVIAGTHTIVVKDANGCVANYTTSITQPSNNPMVVSAVAGSISCFGGTALVTVSATGGTAPYTGTGAYSVGAGTRTFTVRDANGIVQTATVTVSSPTEIIVNVSAASDISVLGGTTSVSVNATGGTGTYRYSLDGGVSQTTSSFRSVGAGNHYITVVDANGCVKVATFTVNQLETSGFTVSLVSKTDATCKGARDGTIEVVAAGGRAPYTYSIGTGTYSINYRFYNLKAGIYRVHAKDANNNIADIIVVIADGKRRCPNTGRLNSLVINAFPNPSAQYFNLTVDSDSDEDINVNVMDLNGRIMFTDKGIYNKGYRFGENFKPGVYFVRVLQGSQMITQKVIKL